MYDEPMVADSMSSSHVHFNEDQLPEIKSWKVGQVYKLEITVRQRDTHLEGEDKVGAEFDIIEVKAKSKRSYDTKVGEMGVKSD